MNETQLKDRPRDDEARILTTLCAQANAARRTIVNIQMGETRHESNRSPRRLIASH